MGYHFGGPNGKDYSMFGSNFGFPCILGSYHKVQISQAHDGHAF